uniref:ADP-ribose/CDP-alcohol diphosphatase, manganese dependent n=1 Tax=Oryzias latipes TaxID=8090 RepID=H2MD59_ORYLA
MDECLLQEPLFTFGVIADVQYADIDDGYKNYSRRRDRYYRSSLQLLSNAQDAWREARVQPLFVLQLGDLIDAPVHHVWGNHEFYNFSRSALLRSPLNSRLHADSGAGAAPVRPDIYAYRFTPVPGFTFVVLDAYDVSLLGREESSEEYRSAMELIRKYNQNQDLNCPPAFADLRQRFTMFNGGFSKEQLDWLDSVLTSADEKQERVTIASHLPVHPFSTDAASLAWNFEELLAVIHSHKCVVCYMAGHAHDGGYHHDKDTGVHHLTLDGVIETPPYSDAFGIVSVYADRMELKGSGRVLDRLFLFS